MDITHCIDHAITWLESHWQSPQVASRLLDWLCHLCLQQFRVNVAYALQCDLGNRSRQRALKGQLPFHLSNIRALFSARKFALVSGNRSPNQTPQRLANLLFEDNNGQDRQRWIHKPFRLHYKQILHTLHHLDRSRRLEFTFVSRHRQMLFLYHWLLPYPSQGSFTQRRKTGERMWYSIKIQPEAAQTPLHDVRNSDWIWARATHQPGRPPQFPVYLEWPMSQWELWIQSHLEDPSQAWLEDKNQSPPPPPSFDQRLRPRRPKKPAEDSSQGPDESDETSSE